MEANDIWTKYSAGNAAPEPTQTWAQREEGLAAEAGNPDTVVGFLVNGMDAAVKELVGHLTAGTADRLVKAKQIYDEKLNGTIDGNLESIAKVGALTGGGDRAKQVRERADYASRHAYNDLEFTMPDGRTTTVGRFFSDPDFYANPGKNLTDNGFDADGVAAFLGGQDKALTESLGYFARSKDYVIGQKPGVVVNATDEQDKEGFRAVYQNWDDISRICGPAASTFARHVRNSNLEIGGYSQKIPAVLKWMEARSRRTGLTGYGLVDSVKRDYDRLAGSAVQGDPSPDGTTARPVTAAKRRVVDATAISAIAKMEQFGDVELASDEKIAAMGDCLSLMARMTATGYDVMNGRDGRDRDMIAHFADHVANAGTPAARSGFVYNYLASREMRNSLVTGGRDFTAATPRRSADPADWLKVDKAAGGRSSAPMLDALAADINDALDVASFPVMAAGNTAEGALDGIMRDPAAGDRLMDGLMKAVGKYVSDPRACADIAQSAVRAHRSRVPLNLQQAVFDYGFANAGYAKARPAAAQALRNLYYSSVTAPAQFAEDWAEVLAHVQSDDGLGLSPRDAQVYMSRVGAALADAVNMSKRFGVEYNPRDVLVQAKNSGYYYVPAEDGSGIVRRRTNNLSAFRGRDPVGFTAEQAALKQQYMYEQALIHSAARQRQTAEIRREEKQKDAESGVMSF